MNNNINTFFNFGKNYYYIIDTSYLVYLCASTSFKNYCFQEDIRKELLNPDFDPTIDPEFNIIFEQYFKNKIKSAFRQVTDSILNKPIKIFFARDCRRTNIWRREIFPEYKLQRDVADHSKDKFNTSKVFSYAYSVIIPNYCDDINGVILQNEVAEADDIIAVLSDYILSKNDNNHVIILSSDRDMVQLCNDKTHIITASGEIRDPSHEFRRMLKDDKLPDLTANDFLLFKILIGDKSDNIPNIKSQLGIKTALKYVLDKSHTQLRHLLSEDINIAKGFKRNKELISMKDIPNYIKESIIENIEQYF